MSRIHWKEVLEGIGLVAIIASLIFLAIEVRQSNQIGRLEAMESVANSWSSTGIELASNEGLAELLSKADDGAGRKDFDAIENRRLFNVLHGLDHHWEMRFNQMKLGILTPADYSFPGSGKSSFASAYHKEIWPEIRPGLSEEFAIFWEQRFEMVER